MKRTFALLIGVASCAEFARAGDVQVKAKMMTNPEGEETTTFGADAAELYATFTTKGVCQLHITLLVNECVPVAGRCR